ncbi:MAG: 30S ribosomal protein S4 [Candidatus Nanohaloarchaea archaeon]|nr:30S ribosomal protein S4 [Candidatus Nanohaloarchaea archaeon]
MVKKLKKTYETPKKGWQSERIDQEKDIINDYGLKNKKELWKTESILRDLRREARKLNAVRDEQKEQDLLDKLNRLGVISEGAELTDILDMDLEDILERRLQTIIYRRGLADTMNQARQLINHRHVMVGDQQVDVPGYLVRTEEESEIRMAPGSKHLVKESGGEEDE